MEEPRSRGNKQVMFYDYGDVSTCSSFYREYKTIFQKVLALNWPIGYWLYMRVLLDLNFQKLTECSIKKAVLKNFVILTGKHLCWSFFLIKLQVFWPATLLKRGSNTSVFLWILRNFQEYLLWRTSANGCF